MESAENINQTGEAIAEEAVDQTAGELLQSARETRGLSLRDVSAKTHLSMDMLSALETMKVKNLSPTILRMQASHYARFLGLSASDIASAYSDTNGAPDSTNMPGEILRNSQLENRRSRWPIMVGAAAIVVAGIVFWSVQALISAGPVEPVAEINPIVPPASSTRFQPPVRSTTLPELSIRAISAGWIEVRGSDGTIFRNRNMMAGEVYYPRMDAGWTVTVRDGTAFEWWLGDHAVGALGQEATPVYSINVDEAATRGMAQLETALADAGAAEDAAR